MLKKEIEIFKTNVEDENISEELLSKIHTSFPHYSATFDLEDCDRILRIESRHKKVEIREVIAFLMNSGHKAEVL